MPTSYVMKKQNIPFLFLIMVFLIISVTILLYAAWLGDFQLIILTFLLLGILAAIVMVIAVRHKKKPKQSRSTNDHSLK